MKIRKMGRTHLHVSELCLNTAKFGWAHDDAASFSLLDTFRAGGGNFIQTLAVVPSSVASRLVRSESEEIVGRWQRERGIKRDGLVLASRAGFLRPPHGGSSALANLIRESCERSLRSLRTGHIDLLVCDWDDSLAPVEDLLEAVDRLVRAGYVRHVVAGEFPPWRVVDANHRAVQRNRVRFEALQAEYSLLRRDRFEPEVQVLCREHRLGFLARSPLSGGFLGRRLAAVRESVPGEPSWTSERFSTPAADAVLQVLNDIAEARGATPAQVALAWVLRNPQVSAAVVSAHGPDELLELIQGTRLSLNADDAGALVNLTASRDGTMALRHV